MRGIGLVVAGCLVAACGGPGEDEPANVAAERSADIEARNDGAPAEPGPPPEAANTGDAVQAGSVGPCLMQGADRLEVAPIRAVGTEPFWGARVEGRCVTYSTPENQQGVRIWTRYSAEPKGGGTWVGQLEGKKFEMRVRPQAGCSDGMSDERYPLAVELAVNGEQRKGCAEPL